ncbi:hypothetical protein L1987_29469 [Smallanthus sonchifolius]|uniref:Uncharacterized protein n=1 Tax=Smallanthus sonchifolius TaxID=185202 RepID=A0ACB9I1V8_9ASTR|nr:hypothetical protein L1987_29469 [Smallanthus sonchifolius]
MLLSDQCNVFAIGGKCGFFSYKIGLRVCVTIDLSEDTWSVPHPLSYALPVRNFQQMPQSTEINPFFSFPRPR